MTVPTLACETCPNPIERTGKRGPAPRFCDPCKLDRHNARQRTRYVRKGHGPRPGAVKHHEGKRFPSGLVLAKRIPGDSDRAWFQCGEHVVKLLHIRAVVDGKTVNCASRDHHPDPRCTSAPAYSTVHHRKRASEGPASERECWRCGGQADDYAYLHGDPSPLVQLDGKDAGMPYSADPEQLAPLCRSCHRVWDETKGRTAGPGISLAHVALWNASHAEEVAA
ncbi:hypothetical protein AB0G55_04925 [Streptomyces toyocaensis]|uniref:hypothetical protein n=1 Tax=Streptomyces toyocaensis TaxID=55952 RepID=UPI0012FEF764|nr:hypothetical protein [Streptomyces toyocaensis]